MAYSMSDLLQLVVSEGSSDLHIRVGIPPTIRVHGILHRVEGPPCTPEDAEELMRSITSDDHVQQIRERGGADFGFAFGDAARFRVSAFKEKGNFGLVLRQIPNKLLTMEQIGIPPSTRELLYKPRGLVLVTGPTGSGKTTTLASMINIINEERDDAHIITIEDPIEYQLQGVGQMQVNPKIDLTFANGLRSILRQDPDVIMVGEIRDGETAEIAIQAALTGHLVFSTLHTNDSASAVTRLVEMGTEPFLVSSSVLAVMAQRLLRRVCDRCRRLLQPTPEMLAEVGIAPERASGRTLYAGGAGCEACKHTGYRGRTGIHELLVVDDDIRALIMKNADASAIRRAAVAAGMATLREDGADKILTGETTIEEVLRVTQDDAL